MYEYLRPMIQGCRKILVVDMGWFGTGGLAIKFLLEEKYGQDIEVLSALVGTTRMLLWKGGLQQESCILMLIRRYMICIYFTGIRDISIMYIIY